MTFIRKAWPISAMRVPSLPRPSERQRHAFEIEADRGLPGRAGLEPDVLVADVSRQVEHEPGGDGRRSRLPKLGVPQTTTPRALAAARSTEALRLPVVTSSFSAGSFSTQRARERRALAHDAQHLEPLQGLRRGVNIGERLVEHLDAGCRPASFDQSAILKATFW